VLRGTRPVISDYRRRIETRCDCGHLIVQHRYTDSHHGERVAWGGRLHVCEFCAAYEWFREQRGEREPTGRGADVSD